MTEYKRVLIQSGERRRRTGHKINSQIECTIIRKIQTSLEMFKTFYSSSDGRMNCFYSDIGCSESKVIFKWRKTNKNNENKKKKPLQGANVRTSWISFSPSQNSHETNKRRRYSPWARKWNPPPPPPSGIVVDMYHFKASPKGIWKMHVCTWLLGGCGCAATFFSSAKSNRLPTPRGQSTSSETPLPTKITLRVI